MSRALWSANKFIDQWTKSTNRDNPGWIARRDYISTKTENALIRVHKGAGLTGPSLFVCGIRILFFKLYTNYSHRLNTEAYIYRGGTVSTVKTIL